ncbi:hypothetical protein CUZ56_00481 [Saezia sanguinis]|uniref:Uncharacterized protein n=1 Tax=Saezia sanguinis TaxID=1965230 RepID=A0A433SGX5_9BURK|nr:hypothetical protein [Saezia sanguinis]RUS67985.1 hypothetical protein CUZ56_00468 [Saezia sanguinis]RUS67998.1 hypothetical protein CUZ56_00481 [Saezia sanguinis]
MNISQSLSAHLAPIYKREKGKQIAVELKARGVLLVTIVRQDGSIYRGRFLLRAAK